MTYLPLCSLMLTTEVGQNDRDRQFFCQNSKAPNFAKVKPILMLQKALERKIILVFFCNGTK